MGGFKYYSSECLFINEFNKALIDEFNFLCKYANKIILTIPIQYEDFLKWFDKHYNTYDIPGFDIYKTKYI